MRGMSPFSNEKTPSFYVVPGKGIFKDFSSGKGGSAITFLMEHEKLSYPEALRWLAGKYGIEIEERKLTPEELEEQTERRAFPTCRHGPKNGIRSSCLKQAKAKAWAWDISASRDLPMPPSKASHWAIVQSGRGPRRARWLWPRARRGTRTNGL